MNVDQQSLVLGDSDTSAPWYTTRIGIDVLENARDILEKYARVSPENVETHVLTLVRFYLSTSIEFGLTEWLASSGIKSGVSSPTHTLAASPFWISTCIACVFIVLLSIDLRNPTPSI